LLWARRDRQIIFLLPLYLSLNPSGPRFGLKPERKIKIKK